MNLLRGNFAPDEPPGELYGLDDLLVTGTAAQVSRQRPFDRADVGIGVPVQQRLGRHDHTGGAEPALDGARQHKGLLDQVRVIGRPQPLNGDNVRTVEPGYLEKTGPDRFPVDNYGAGAALPLPVTRLLGAGKAQVPAQIVQEDHIRSCLNLTWNAVDCERYCVVHFPFLLSNSVLFSVDRCNSGAAKYYTSLS